MSEYNEDAASLGTTPNERPKLGAMKLHPRFVPVEEWKSKAKVAFWTAVSDTDMTEIEVIACVGELLQDAVKYALRKERHGRTDKKADEA